MSNETVNNMQQEINKLRTGRKLTPAIAETSQVNDETSQACEATPAVSEASADMLAQITALRKENEALRTAANSPLKIKVSDKGAVSVYGLGKWPLTLYRSQWEKLIAHTSAVKSFIEVNSSKLASKES